MSAKHDCQTAYYYVGAIIDDRYELTDFIGSGGMACVYRAVEQGTPHAYALKFLKAEFHNQPYLIRYFEQEASNMRDLAHPNIVRFYRFVNADAYSYIIMEYIDGYALSDIIKRMYEQQRHIPLDEVVRVMTQVARGLDAIHREGFVHRDIKPSNVLIQKSDGKAFLGDLGITTMTNTEMLGAGTLAYMAPEQSSRGIADHRSDIYAYGIMLFELLARQRPFRPPPGLSRTESEAALVELHRDAPVPDVTPYRAELPAALNAIMRRALAKAPDDRYDSIMDLARDVHQALKSQLSPDLQDFAAISHIAGLRNTQPLTAVRLNGEAAPRRRLRGQWMTWLLLVIAVVIIGGIFVASGALPRDFFPGTPMTDQPVLTAEITEPEATEADSIVTAEIQNTDEPISLPSATEAPPTITPTAQATPTATLTSTPNPVEGQPYYPFVGGVAALSRPADTDRLIIQAEADHPLHYLRVGAVDGFRLNADVMDFGEARRFGVAFRIQDESNYLAFVLDVPARRWEFVEVLRGQRRTLRDGSLDDVPLAPFSTVGRDGFFVAQLGEYAVELTHRRWRSGSLALWLEAEAGAELELTSLEIGLIGPEAVQAAVASPTPAAGLGDPFRSLREDVNALLATSDVASSAVNCPLYIDIFDTLSRHTSSPNETVRTLAEDVIRAGQLIYSRCQAESPEAPLTFITSIQDYLDWESALRQISQQIAPAF